MRLSETPDRARIALRKLGAVGMYWIGVVAFLLAGLVLFRARARAGKAKAMVAEGRPPPELRPEFQAMRGLAPLFAMAMMGLGMIILLIGFFGTQGGGVLSLFDLVGALALILALGTSVIVQSAYRV